MFWNLLQIAPMVFQYFASKEKLEDIVLGGFADCSNLPYSKKFLPVAFFNLQIRKTYNERNVLLLDTALYLSKASPHSPIKESAKLACLNHHPYHYRPPPATERVQSFVRPVPPAIARQLAAIYNSSQQGWSTHVGTSDAMWVNPDANLTDYVVPSRSDLPSIPNIPNGTYTASR